MNIIKTLRLYHAALAISALLAYVTGELGLIHAWLGYGVALIIIFRLLLALGGTSQLGLLKFYPSFQGLNISNALTHPAISKTLLSGIALSVVFVTITGIMMDEGKALGLADVNIITPALADDNGEYEGENDEEGGFIGEAHEFFANIMLLFVGMHVTYLFLFKRSLALYMLFIQKKK
jgi:cytochrome b